MWKYQLVSVVLHITVQLHILIYTELHKKNSNNQK